MIPAQIGRPRRQPVLVPQLSTYMDPAARAAGIQAFGGDIRLFRLFCYLINQNYYDWDSGYQLIRGEDVAAFTARPRANPNIRGQLLELEQYGVRVDVFQPVNRAINFRGLQFPQRWDFVRQILFPRLPLANRVRIFDGREYEPIEGPQEPEPIRRDIPLEMENLLLALREANLDVTAEDIEVLRQTNLRLWQEQQRSEHSIRRNAAILNRFELTRSEEYTVARQASRIFPNSISCTTREIRSIFQQQKGFVTFDIKACQLSIARTLWHVPELDPYLEEGADCWDVLSEELHIDDPLARGKLKVAVYAIVFGRNQHIARQEMARVFDRDIAERFLELPVIQSLIRQRDRHFNTIREQGAVIDCYERRHPLAGATARGLTAIQIQSLEHKIAGGGALFANQINNINLKMFLHDGFSVEIPRELRENSIREITRSMIRAGEEYNIEIKIEVNG